MIRKTPGWQARLAACLAASARSDFGLGKLDCALHGAAALAAMTGVDLAAPYRGRYRTLRGGLRHLRRDGYADHIALAAAHLRQREPGEAPQPGDLAVVETDAGPALGVVQGASLYLRSPAGLGLLPVSRASIIFEVP